MVQERKGTMRGWLLKANRRKIFVRPALLYRSSRKSAGFSTWPSGFCACAETADRFVFGIRIRNRPKSTSTPKGNEQQKKKRKKKKVHPTVKGFTAAYKYYYCVPLA